MSGFVRAPRSPRRFFLGDTAVAWLCLAAGLLFLLSLANLWPLADFDLVRPSRELRGEARRFLE